MVLYGKPDLWNSSADLLPIQIMNTLMSHNPNIFFPTSVTSAHGHTSPGPSIIEKTIFLLQSRTFLQNDRIRIADLLG